jgi:hypothetical protein
VIGSPAKRRGWVLATALAVALTGCSHNSKSGSPRADASVTTSIATTTTTPSEAVVAAWRRYWDVYVAVATEMKLPDPRLAEVATGEELRQLGSGFLAFKSAGEIFKGTIDLDPKVSSIAGASATLRDCYLSHILGYDAATGKPKGAEDTTRRLVTVTLQLDAGVWKVAAIRHDGDGCTSS